MGNFACEFAESSHTIRRRVAGMFEELMNRMLRQSSGQSARGRKEADELAEQRS